MIKKMSPEEINETFERQFDEIENLKEQLQKANARIAGLENASEPDLFWDVNNTETGFNSVEELFEYHFYQGTEVGLRIEVQQAVILPNAVYELTELNHEDGSFEVAEVKDE